MMAFVFWLTFSFVCYVYFGYPALLLIWRRFSRQPVEKRYWEPSVSIVIAAHNERQNLERKLANCFSLDYPKRKLQIILSLDGPTDGSEFVMWKYATRGVDLVHSRQHTGKAAALNRAMRRATGEIVVFADVRQLFDRQAIRELVASLADNRVGAATGELLLMDESQQEASTDVGLYWRYEKAIRSLESDIHSVAGATGAIYAIRRELYEELPEDTLLDDVLTPLRIVLKGRRVVFGPDAKAYDTISCCPLAEYGRKVRTLAGNYQLLKHVPEAMLPWRNPIYIQVLSHKVARLLVPWALLVLFVTNLFLLRGFYVLTFALQLAWYACAAAGYLFSKREIVMAMPVPDEGKRAA